MEWIASLLAGIFGLLTGSFLNVCALRWPADQSVFRPRSRCQKCESPILLRDNIPVLSWLFLRGRCRNCAGSISAQYPLVEAGTALMWAAVFALHWPNPEAFRGAIFLVIIFGISISDARYYVIPDEFSIGGTLVGIFLAALPGGIDLVDSFIGAGLGYGVLWLVGTVGTWLIKKISPYRLEQVGVDKAMGGGDIKMSMMIGSFVGVEGIALTVFIASLLAIVITVAQSIPAALDRSEDRSIGMGRLIPFGVFLAGGGAICYFWGDEMLAWYMRSMLGMAV